jgi:guanylate kinase
LDFAFNDPKEKIKFPQIILKTTHNQGLRMNDGKLIVFTGPSGVGKGTLLKSLLSTHPELYLSTSATTRSPREGEVDGVDYYFYTRDRFAAMIQGEELLEWAEFAGNYYGTPIAPIKKCIAEGKSIILEIELAGARQVARIFPTAIKIFILPPSMEELEARIRGRGTDTEDAILRRLHRAQEEIAAADEFDYQIVNDELEVTLARLEEIIK